MLALLIILDGVGVGELPDADKYGDIGSDTLGNLSIAVKKLYLPNLEKMGLGNIHKIAGVPPVELLSASVGKMAEQSSGKDSTSGHWEICGLIRKDMPALYLKGFPEEIIKHFKEFTGLDVLGNIPSSGTEIIDKLGNEHYRTGKPIVYTSADSVFQIASHINVIPLEKLYDLCEVVRTKIMNGNPYSVDRVIARPFEGKFGNYRRTKDRKDFSITPPGKTVLDIFINNNIKVYGIGKVDNLFAGRGFTECEHTGSNAEGILKTKNKLGSNLANKNFIFANLIDFDQSYGHRNDVFGFAQALKEFDNAIPDIISLLQDGDLLIITADHGNDPTTSSTDHSREYVPLIAFRKAMKTGINLGTRESFSDISATLIDFFKISEQLTGESFLKDI